MINVVVSAQELAVPGDVADVDDGALDAHLGRGVGDLPEKGSLSKTYYLGTIILIFGFLVCQLLL